MEIIIEIGTLEQQALVRQELSYVTNLVDKSEDVLKVLQLIVPLDYDAKVNEIQGTKSFVAVRGVGENKVAGAAKTIPVEGGFVLVLSPVLYLEIFDEIWRMFVVIHEIFHVISLTASPENIQSTGMRSSYLGSLRRIYDEYWADRQAYKVLDTVYPKKSDNWNEHIRTAPDGFKEMLADPVYLATIRGTIEDFHQKRIDVGQLMDRIKPSMDEVAMITAHALALIDHYRTDLKLADLGEYPFLNQATRELAEYFKVKFDQDDPDLDDGIEAIATYMATFGIWFEDIPGGMYCHVVDI